MIVDNDAEELIHVKVTGDGTLIAWSLNVVHLLY